LGTSLAGSGDVLPGSGAAGAGLAAA
jgi:hypothetical protein